MAYLIKANGEVTKIKPSNGVAFTLLELHDLVGGEVELLGRVSRLYFKDPDTGKTTVRRRREVVVVRTHGQEEGLLENTHASVSDVLFGDVVVGIREELGG